ncbi:MAG: helix-turn-helix transcriptional regulator [Acidimicrobiia bacterium]
MSELSDAKRRILERLKRVDSATAPVLAELFDTTDTAIRQHLEALEQAGLVERFLAAPNGRGRPPLQWRITALAADLFPDRHGELSVELIGAIREALGEDGLEQVIAVRAARQRNSYQQALGRPGRGDGSVAVRLRRLAELRTAEGYLAEVVTDDDGHVLVEHHCPVHDAAGACEGLCRAELELFRSVLGPGVRVERAQHLLRGDARCAYRISET